MRKTWSEADFTLRDARAELRKWIAEEQLSHLEADLTLIVTELLTNAAAIAVLGDELKLEVKRNDNEVLIAVSSRGDDFSVSGTMPAADSIRGRGLAIVNALSTSVQVRSRGPLVTVYAVVSI